jgi:adenylosuccinate lyase
MTVNPSQMLSNISSQRGLIFAEAASNLIAGIIGKESAHQLVEIAARRVANGESDLRCVLDRMIAADPKVIGRITSEKLDAAFSAALTATAAGRYVDITFSDIQSHHATS